MLCQCGAILTESQRMAILPERAARVWVWMGGAGWSKFPDLHLWYLAVKMTGLAGRPAGFPGVIARLENFVSVVSRARLGTWRRERALPTLGDRGRVVQQREARTALSVARARGQLAASPQVPDPGPTQGPGRRCLSPCRQNPIICPRYRAALSQWHYYWTAESSDLTPLGGTTAPSAPRRKPRRTPPRLACPAGSNGSSLRFLDSGGMAAASGSAVAPLCSAS